MSIIFKIKKSLGLTEDTYHIRRPGSGDDALACVAMLLYHYGQSVSFSRFKKEYAHFRGINSIEKLTELCSLNGLQTQYFEGNYLEIKNVNLPCIIRWRMNRYAVLIKVEHETYYIFDPYYERYEYQQYEAECHYCESALIVCSHETQQELKS